MLRTLYLRLMARTYAPDKRPHIWAIRALRPPAARVRAPHRFPGAVLGPRRKVPQRRPIAFRVD